MGGIGGSIAFFAASDACLQTLLFSRPKQESVGLAERGIVFACYTPSATVCSPAAHNIRGTLLTTIEKQCLNVGSKVGNCHLDD